MQQQISPDRLRNISSRTAEERNVMARYRCSILLPFPDVNSFRETKLPFVWRKSCALLIYFAKRMCNVMHKRFPIRQVFLFYIFIFLLRYQMLQISSIYIIIIYILFILLFTLVFVNNQNSFAHRLEYKVRNLSGRKRLQTTLCSAFCKFKVYRNL